MTSPAAPSPVARRRAAVPAIHRLSRNVLVIGTILALAATLGPAWVVRIGVLVAVVAALAACTVAWRELSEARRSHSLQMLAASQAHGLALSQERRDNASVVETLAERNRQAVAETGKLQVVVVRLTQRLSTLTAQNAFLHSEVRHRDRVIDGLRDSVRSRDAELVALRRESYAQVRAIPRRALTDPRPLKALRDELSAAESGRRLLDPSPPRPMVLPNYEEDRKLA